MGTDESGDHMNNPEVLKRTLGFLTAALTFAAVSVSCSKGTVSTDKDSSNVSETTAESTLTADTMSAVTSISSDLFSARDLDPSYDTVTAEIILSGDSIKVDGSGALAEGSIVTITDEGVYHVTGSLNDGQMIVNAPDAKVQLVLDGAELNCSTTSSIYIADCDKTFITLADGSQNTVTDGSEYTFAEDTVDEPDAAIFSEDSLTINGSGSLTVNGNYNDGIRSKDDIVITGGTINVTAVGNGIKGKDYVAATSADITIDAGGDGIKATNIDDASLGFVYIESGEFDITAGGDGIQAETVFNAAGGNVKIVSNGGSSNAAAHGGNDFGGMGGFGGRMPNMQDGGFGGHGGMRGGFDAESGATPDGEQTPEDTAKVTQTANITPLANTADNADTTEKTDKAGTGADTTNEDDGTVSTKAIKAGTELNISGGSFDLSASDDTLHSNGTLTISGGELTLDAGGDGIHADTQLDITDGSVTVSKSYEGIESAVINVSGGTVEVNSSDDGFNASDGSSQGAMGSAANGVELNISGGMVYVNASGDGLDSNGDMTISGGAVLVSGPTNDGNGALDGNSSINVTGGILAAAGSSGMAEYPDDTSTQNSVSYTFDSQLEGGTLVTLLDSSGNEILSFAPEKEFINIVISSPDIKTGETYTFYTGGSSSSAEIFGLYENGGYKNDGTQAESFTADSVVSTIGTQSTMGGGHGGAGGFGGGAAPEMPTDENGDISMPDDMPSDMPNGMTPPDKNGGGDFRPDEAAAQAAT